MIKGVKVKVIYDQDGSPDFFESEVQNFINREDIEILEIKHSHAEITDDKNRFSATSFSAMIVYYELNFKGVK